LFWYIPQFAWKTVHEERMLCEVERRRTAVWLPFRSKGEGKDKPIPVAIQTFKRTGIIEAGCNIMSRILLTASSQGS